MFIQLFNLKNKGILYCVINLISIFVFTLLYKIFDHIDDSKKDDSLIYWIYFSAITQTTVGYAGLELNSDENQKYISLKSYPLKICILVQLLSIIFINGFFLTI